MCDAIYGTMCCDIDISCLLFYICANRCEQLAARLNLQTKSSGKSLAILWRWCSKSGLEPQAPSLCKLRLDLDDADGDVVGQLRLPTLPKNTCASKRTWVHRQHLLLGITTKDSNQSLPHPCVVPTRLIARKWHMKCPSSALRTSKFVGARQALHTARSCNGW